MYRRKQKIQEKKEPKVEKVETKPVVNSEPEIKKVVAPRKEEGEGKAPMLNILRDIEYFGNPGEATKVDFNEMVNTVFSSGYLNVDTTAWYKYGSTWSESFKDTTNYKRNSFMCGDVLYFADAKRTFAFLITAVYSKFFGEGSNANVVSSALQYNPPVGVGGNDETEAENPFLSSFVTCDGDVYMFAKGKKFNDLAEELISKDSTTGEYRVLHPSNVSQYKGPSEVPNYTGKHGETPESEKPSNYPTSVPVVPETEQSAQFNLNNGTVVEGWFIYMKKVEEVTVGDIIRTGPVVIAKVGDMLTIGNSFRIPFITEGSIENMYYDGNDTKLASEPLNSEHYQKNYGDTVGSRQLALTDSKIFSLEAILKYATAPSNPEEP